MIYYFTNRRRAKDALMTLLDTRGSGDITVFVREEVVYVYVTDAHINGIEVIMHYAELSDKPIDDLLELGTITELYRGNGIRRFHV